MKVAIMQPYFLPYIGYFQLINAVDVFVVYDNVEYTKKGWINRNRILVNGEDEFITLPLKKDSDFLHINQRLLSDSFEQDKQKILRKIKECYRKAPYFNQVQSLVEDIFRFENINLFEFVFNSIKAMCNYFEINSKLIISSEIRINHKLKSEEKIIAICKNQEANIYINPIGGLPLYSQSTFKQNKIKLQFIKSNIIQYPQFNNDFIPWLSIIDLLMFNGVDKVKEIINKEFQLIENESV